jgi:pimeloyl-ACP methyl ester carboxylesterase
MQSDGFTMKAADSSASRAFHLFLGGTAALAATRLDRNSRLRIPLAMAAGLELGRGLGYSSSPATGPSDGDAAPELTRSAVVDGVLMRWEEHGARGVDSIPLVMLHGLPTNPRAWRYVIPRVLRDGVRCLAWEQVGFGWSMAEGLGRDISIPKQAEYLHSWLRHLGITRAVFVAHDYGGGVMQHFLLAHPEMCMGLVLTDCVAYDNWPVVAVRIARSMNRTIEQLPPTLVKPFFLAAVFNLGHDNVERGLESAALHWQPYNRPVGPRAFAHQLRHFDARDTLTVAHELPRLKLDVPIRVVWGEEDPLGMASAEQIAADLGAPLRRIPGGRHFTLEDHPGVIAEAINAVLADVAIPAAAGASH